MTNGIYATKADLIAKYSEKTIKQLADRNNDGTIDSATLMRVWEEVDSEIDAYLATAGYRKTSLGEVPALLKGIAIDLAFAGLHTGKVAELIEARAKLARETLVKIAHGKMKLAMPNTTNLTSKKTVRSSAKKKPKSIVDGM